MDVSKNRWFSPKMDGENNEKPDEQMDDLGFFPLFLETPISSLVDFHSQISGLPPSNCMCIGTMKESICIRCTQ